jgi:alkanesulfonate monooxygenase SsuD/methylene tetrahydromethanopterin reductase-like flavin-dependent oxidoreductase (luciferase family)
MTVTSLAFLAPGNYLDDDPYTGLEQTLELFELGERLGFDGAWIRQRHLEHGVSSAAVFLAAASQRTKRIELGTAVIPIGYESPFRLGEDLATADVLSRGRLQVGLSAGLPPHADLIGDLVFDGDWRSFDFSHNRISRLASHLGGDYIGDENTVVHSPGNVQRARLQPVSAGLVDRLWYGGGSIASIQWAAQNGFNLLLGNVTSGEATDDFVTAQSGHLRLFEEKYVGERTARVAVGRVILPTDSATPATAARYREYAANRTERTTHPNGERRTLFARDLVGTSAEIIEQLLADAAVSRVSELRVELPYEFSHDDYEQILHDVATSVAPALGWKALALTH